MNVFIDWKYNNKTILTTKENDFHCSINEVKTWKEMNNYKFSLLSKSDKTRQVFSIQPIQGVNHLEVWIRTNHKPQGWKQHDIVLPEEK